MDHCLYGIYEQWINQSALIIHIVRLDLIRKRKKLSFFALARICKDETHKFGAINKVIWTAMKSSYVMFLNESNF
jgi:hypothetical protein